MSAPQGDGTTGPGSSPASSAADELAAVWARFRPTTLARVDVLEDAAIALLEDRLTTELRARAEREAHKLAGSSGTFGFPRASRIARDVEKLFAGDRLARADTVALSDQLLLLRADLEGAPEPPHEIEARAAVARPSLLIVSSDPLAAERYVMEAEGRGYSAVLARSATEAMTAVQQTHPNAALVAFAEANSDDDLLGLLHHLQSLSQAVPTVAIAPRDRAADRVVLARRGVRRCLNGPVSPKAALDAVVAVVSERQPANGTLIYVDGDARARALVSSMLDTDGWRVVAVTDANDFWPTLERVNPDIVVVESKSHEGFGFDLCRAIRNEERWIGLPVAFIDAQPSTDRLARAFAAGVDDYILAPVIPSELVVRLSNRLRRTRGCRLHPETDGLTGLPSRSGALALIERFVGLAQRMSQTIALSVVALDHPLEDSGEHSQLEVNEALRALSRRLAQSSGATDIVGRWTDDGFIVASYGSSKADAVRDLGNVLTAVTANTSRSADATAGHMTFSAGVAQFPVDAVDRAGLCREAESALHRARATGRGRVQGSGDSDAADGDHGIRDEVDVVVVDDDEALIGLLAHGLESRDLRVRTFPDGESAVRGLGGPSPAVVGRVIILDVDLPALNGYDVLRQLSRDGVTRKSRVIMLTARNAEEDVLSGLGLGAVDHVNKPFSMQILLQKVLSALNPSAE